MSTRRQRERRMEFMRKVEEVRREEIKPKRTRSTKKKPPQKKKEATE